jgi:hypothetical protein
MNPVVDGTVEEESHFGRKDEFSLGQVDLEVAEQSEIQQNMYF